MELLKGNRHFLYNRAVFNKNISYIDEEQIYVIGNVKCKFSDETDTGFISYTSIVYMCVLEVMTFNLLFDLHLRVKIAISFLEHISETHGGIIFIMHTQISANVPFAGLFIYMYISDLT